MKTLIMKINLIILVCGTLLFCNYAGAKDEILQKGLDAYNTGKFQDALTYLKQASKAPLNKDDKSEALKYLGFAYAATGNLNLAKDAFTELLMTNPEYTLSEDEASPKIIKVFEQTREEKRTIIIQTRAERLYEESKTYLKKNDFDKALAKVNEAMKFNPLPKYKAIIDEIAKAKAEFEAKKKIEAKLVNMVLIPAGDAVLGFSKTRTVVKVEAFYIDKYLVSNRDYSYFVEEKKKEPPKSWTGGSYPLGKADHPVVYVSYDESVEYCAWKNKRLPTEEEWEKAARGPEGLNYPYGNAFTRGLCNTSEAKIKDTTPTYASKQCVNAYGVLDMSGNVWEWVDSSHSDKGILKGGSYKSNSDDALLYKNKQIDRTKRSEDFGFRCAMNPLQ